MVKKNIRQLTVCIVLILLNLSFIWGNSLLPGEDSSELSGFLTECLEEVFGEAGPGIEHVIRKMAHFSEFACLGLLLTWMFQLLSQKGIHSFTLPLLCGSLTALLDETLQKLSPGRDPNVIDVWIDTAGVAAGILILLLCFWLWKKRRNNISMEETKL